MKAEKQRLQQETEAADGLIGEIAPTLGYVARNTVLFSREARNELGQFTGKADAIRQIVAAVSTRWKNPPGIEVINSMADAPSDVTAEYERQNSQGADGEAEGFYHRGKVYLVASALNTPADVTRVLFHETLGHAGLRGVFGQALEPILDQIATLRGDLLRPVAEQYGLNLDNRTDRLVAAEEVLAFLAQTKPEIGYVKRAIAAIRTWLRANIPGFEAMKLSDTEIVNNFILPARRFVEREPTRSTKQGQPNAMREPLTAYARSETTQAAYDDRIDALFAGAPANRNGVQVLDSSDLLGLLGYPKKPVVLAEGKVMQGKDNHPLMTAEVWKKVPQWLENPAAAFNSETDGGLVVIAPELVGGRVVSIILRPDTEGRNALNAHLLINAYDRAAQTPFMRWINDGLLKYASQKKFPALFQEVVGRQLPNTALQNKPGTFKILSEKNLAGYRRANGLDGGAFSRADQTQTDAFKRWFGDSKVVDAQGKPLVVYHGTPAMDFTAFEAGEGAFGEGMYFADTRAGGEAWADGGRTIEAYLSLQNPYLYAAKNTDFPENFPTTDELKDAGHDGVIVAYPDGGKEFVAFRPEQIKSATGNNGNFDPADPDVRFSRTADPRNPNTFSQKTTDVFNDLMASTKTFNGWWHKSVGTQYHKAQKDREFKRVYDTAQSYIGDVSKLSNDAADLARDLLPRLNRLADVFKGGAKEADVKAIGKAIFQGTLADKREYKPEELTRVFGLTEPQIALYQQFRAATNKSLDVLTASTAAKLLENGGFTKAQIQEAIDASDHRAMLRMVQDVAARDPKARPLAEQVREVSARADQLQAEGYAPLMRFGQFAVSARDAKDGSLQEFYLFESQFQANRKARELEATGKFKVDRSIMSQDDFKLLGGISPESLELFGDVLAKAGVMDPKDAVFEAFIRNAVAQRSAMKRMLERQGFPGYSTDVRRVLASFITSNARLASKNLHFSDMLGAAESISKTKGDVRDEATKLVNYVQNPEEEAGGLRSLLFVKYIGGSAASALVNLTQSLTMTLPYLSQFSSPVKASALLTSAMKQAVTGVTEPDLKKAMLQAEQSGLVSPQEIHHLNAEAMQTLGSNPAIQKALFVWGSMFGAAEQYNRRVAFIAGWNTAVAKGEADPYAFAQKTVEETQGVYNKGNRPNWARGAVGATIFTFKQFSISYMEFLTRLPNREKALALAILMLAAGAEGLPFADDLDDVIDTIAQKLGYSFNSKQEKRRFLASVLGQGGAEFALKGLSALPGMPIDVAGRMGMANLLPGTGVLREDVRDHMGDVFEFLGPAGGVVKDMISKNIIPGSALDVANNAIAPTAVRNLAHAIDMFQTGKYRDKDGRKVVDVEAADAAMKMIGFQPAEVARDSLQTRLEVQDTNLAKNVEQSIARDWALSQLEGDTAGVLAARQRLRDWNEKNPDQRIAINTAQIAQRLRQMRQSRADRIIKSTPKELRPGVQEALR